MSRKSVAKSCPVECPFCHSDLYTPSDGKCWFDSEGQAHDNPDGSRVIGIYDWDRDMTIEYLCPDCNARWPR
jgi:hypothetical protein